MGQSHLNIHTWYSGKLREKSSRQNENCAFRARTIGPARLNIYEIA